MNQATSVPEALHKLVGGTSLTRSEARALMEEILHGRATEAQLGALLAALRLKGEAVDELVGFAEAMRAHAQPIFSQPPTDEPLLDTCGTGGDGAGTFNVSTAAALVAAAAGVRVAKHGNRSISSRCGSADVMEALGVNIELPPAQIGACIREVGIGFVFAPRVHTAMRHAQNARRELRFRSVFNLLGPLTNPAGVNAQVLGVFDARWLEPLARALAALGSRRAFVVHSRDGLDEVSLAGETRVAELHQGQVTRYEVRPEDFGLPRAATDAVRGGDAAVNGDIIRRVLDREKGPARDIVIVNTALALVAAGRADLPREAVLCAAEAIDSGLARQTLARLVEFTRAHNPAATV
ncbi:MAG: anthranilate phosphoribosyltransferase [Acidobacteria bacterium]|nr:anthranilate phosphoribosyltransferase [Acidobacteriota bacterium]